MSASSGSTGVEDAPSGTPLVPVPGNWRSLAAAASSVLSLLQNAKRAYALLAEFDFRRSGEKKGATGMQTTPRHMIRAKLTAD